MNKGCVVHPETTSLFEFMFLFLKKNDFRINIFILADSSFAIQISVGFGSEARTESKGPRIPSVGESP